MRLAQIFLLAGVIAAAAAVAATRPASSAATASASSVACTGTPAAPVAPPTPAGRHFTLVVHGGAGNFRASLPEDVAAERATLKEAMEAGYRIFYRGGSS